MYNLSEVIDLATLEVLKLPFAQKTASFTLSGAMAAERAERSAATVGGIDGMAEYLNELAARKQSAQFREDTGFKVSEEQLPYWAGRGRRTRATVSWAAEPGATPPAATTY